MLCDKGPYCQSCFSCSQVRMWALDHKESWVPKIDAFELWCWRRLLRVPWTARKSNQSILKEISPEYCLEGLMLKLKLQYFGHMMWRVDSSEKTLMLGKFEGRRRRGLQRMRWLDGITNSMDMSWVNSESWWWTGRPGVLQSMGSQRVGHDWVIELNWILSTCNVLDLYNVKLYMSSAYKKALVCIGGRLLNKLAPINLI